MVENFGNSNYKFGGDGMVTSDNSFYKILLIRYNGDGTVSRGYFSKFTDSKPNSKVRFTFLQEE